MIWNPGYNEFTYFWGEWPFSQWSDTEFDDDKGVHYTHAEQYMMAEKARLFGDKDSEKLILEAASPDLQKKLGRGVKNFDAEKWDVVAKHIVYTGNYFKFTQNKAALEALLETKGTLLVEASPYDKIWGIGLTAHDARMGKEWRGTNWLGEVLTKLREGLLSDV